MEHKSRPDRLNLAIARRCHVSCSGCYNYFGRDEPDLTRILSSVRTFVRLGLDEATISGGDPLTIRDLFGFLDSLRAVGMKSIKLDTVGVGLGDPERRGELKRLVAAVDFLGIPLDGWSDESALAFRQGRPRLYSETHALLVELNAIGGQPKVIINTVGHRGNLPQLHRIHADLAAHSCIAQWNVFQFTPTDQASHEANHLFMVSDDTFEQARRDFFVRIGSPGMLVDFRSRRSRLGQYLLVNSDGEAWFPDEFGDTVRLGAIAGREDDVLKHWSDCVAELLVRQGVVQPIQEPGLATP